MRQSLRDQAVRESFAPDPSFIDHQDEEEENSNVISDEDTGEGDLMGQSHSFSRSLADRFVSSHVFPAQVSSLTSARFNNEIPQPLHIQHNTSAKDNNSSITRSDDRIRRSNGSNPSEDQIRDNEVQNSKPEDLLDSRVPLNLAKLQQKNKPRLVGKHALINNIYEQSDALTQQQQQQLPLHQQHSRSLSPAGFQTFERSFQLKRYSGRSSAEISEDKENLNPFFIQGGGVASVAPRQQKHKQQQQQLGDRSLKGIPQQHSRNHSGHTVNFSLETSSIHAIDPADISSFVNTPLHMFRNNLTINESVQLNKGSRNLPQMTQSSQLGVAHTKQSRQVVAATATTPNDQSLLELRGSNASGFTPVYLDELENNFSVVHPVNEQQHLSAKGGLLVSKNRAELAGLEGSNDAGGFEEIYALLLSERRRSSRLEEDLSKKSRMVQQYTKMIEMLKQQQNTLENRYNEERRQWQQRGDAQQLEKQQQEKLVEINNSLMRENELMQQRLQLSLRTQDEVQVENNLLRQQNIELAADLEELTVTSKHQHDTLLQKAKGLEMQLQRASKQVQLPQQQIQTLPQQKQTNNVQADNLNSLLNLSVNSGHRYTRPRSQSLLFGSVEEQGVTGGAVQEMRRPSESQRTDNEQLQQQQQQQQKFIECIVQMVVKCAPDGHFGGVHPSLKDSWAFLKKVMQNYAQMKAYLSSAEENNSVIQQIKKAFKVEKTRDIVEALRGIVEGREAAKIESRGRKATMGEGIVGKRDVSGYSNNCNNQRQNANTSFVQRSPPQKTYETAQHFTSTNSHNASTTQSFHSMQPSKSFDNSDRWRQNRPSASPVIQHQIQQLQQQQQRLQQQQHDQQQQQQQQHIDARRNSQRRDSSANSQSTR